MTAPWITELLDGAHATHVRDRDNPTADFATAMRWTPPPHDDPAPDEAA